MQTKAKSTPRVKKSRDKATELGRVRRDYTATPAEHDVLRGTLKALRLPEPPDDQQTAV